SGGSLGASSTGNGGAITQTAGQSTLGALTNDAGGTVTLGGGTLGATSTITSGAISQTAGQSTLGALTVTATGTVGVSGGTLTATSTANAGAITQSGGQSTLGAVTGAGTLTVTGGQVSTGAIRQGGVNVSGAGNVTIANNAGTSVVGALTIATGLGSTAYVEIGNNSLVVDYAEAGPSPAADVRVMLAAGYADGWAGGGLRTALGTGGSPVKIGYSDAATELGLAPGETAVWRGVTVDASSLLIRPTIGGDADLNGAVDLNDLVRLSNNYGDVSGTAGWAMGDFDYNGEVGLNDLVILSNNYGSVLPGLDVGLLLGADFAADLAYAQEIAATGGVVPEPGALGLVGVVALCGLKRRRRR
ncbi:MAG TPA: PEP-CTERM sorting domain-containing protein, partial [Tepidisphaeraceae bacterium]|nr:PEP-CTERM sorting domain-containing protein [Tepidisphaeraceae bacterium]